MVLAQSLNEILNVGSDDLDVHGIEAADFFRDAWFVPPLLYQLQNVRADNIDGEHLAVTNIEKDSAIVGFCTSDCFGGIQHGSV